VERPRPILFLDIDDVLCINSPYGGHDLVTRPHPADLFERLFQDVAKEVLLSVLAEHAPRVVITSSWLKLLDRQGFDGLFRATGLGSVAHSLHDAWEALQDRGMTRAAAIERWLRQYGEDEPFVVLDDMLSGTGLASSRFKKAGRLVLCEAGVGLEPKHLGLIRKALGRAAPECKT
jgi:hypothetical protein